MTAEQTVYDRATGTTYTERPAGTSALRVLYGNRAVRPLTNALVTRRWVSRVLAWPTRRRASTRQIPAFVATHSICLDDHPERAYTSFADFFVRTLNPGARPFDPDVQRLCSPADSKLLAVPVGSTVRVKGFDYTLDQLVGRAWTGPQPRWALVFRLTVDDYHRFSYVDDCTVTDSYELPGRLHTVGPWSDGLPVLAENHRVVAWLETERFGTVVAVVVGAMTVGRVLVYPRTTAARGDEQGRFELGGSTVVLLTDAQVDDDIVDRSRQGVETRVRLGEAVGTAPAAGTAPATDTAP
ncbi:MAG: phosphatidylserine decarboxylase [Micrococcales bacterium]|nr:phosphatidylserine decarboxylase [Micrococcales bacterium]MCL2666691.1 phosphatidylserine decarboxylase [Micrococcales bacterium]